MTMGALLCAVNLHSWQKVSATVAELEAGRMTVKVRQCTRCRMVNHEDAIELAYLRVMHQRINQRRVQPKPKPDERWKSVLGLNGKVTMEEARRNYRRLAAKLHPDKGGSHEAMAELNTAWQQAQDAL